MLASVSPTSDLRGWGRGGKAAGIPNKSCKADYRLTYMERSWEIGTPQSNTYMGELRKPHTYSGKIHDQTRPAKTSFHLGLIHRLRAGLAKSVEEVPQHRTNLQRVLFPAFLFFSICWYVFCLF